MDVITVAIITVSDSRHAGVNANLSGEALRKAVTETLPGAQVIHESIVPDEQRQIQKVLLDRVAQGVHVVLTTGGTGFGPRDVTPEATRAVIEREAPALAQAMVQRSLAVTDMAMLSRAVCGICDKTLIINLPGSPKAATECFGFIQKALPHAVDLLRNADAEVARTHQQLQGSLILEITASKVLADQPAKRARESTYAMVEVVEALKTVQAIAEAQLSMMPIEKIRIEDALGRYLAEDVKSPVNVPAFRSSLMDGYAICEVLRGYGAPQNLSQRNVEFISTAGSKVVDIKLTHNNVVRVSTGAPIPNQTSRVIPVEMTTIVSYKQGSSEEQSIRIDNILTAGANVKEIGGDLNMNEIIASRNDEINPGHIGTFAAIGLIEVNVFPKQLRIGILSTGNELVPPNTKTLELGKIRDSNKLNLLNLLKMYHINAMDLGIARDNPDDIKTAFTRGFEECDVVITTGGVSMGERDFVKDVLKEDFNANIHFGRVNMKPGKPTTFATLTYKAKTKLVFALPGNPASAAVGTILFVIPHVKYRPANITKTVMQSCQAKLVVTKPYKLDTRPEFVRATATMTGGVHEVSLTGNQLSSRIVSFVNANCLVALPASSAEKVEISNGDCVEVILF